MTRQEQLEGVRDRLPELVDALRTFVADAGVPVGSIVAAEEMVRRLEQDVVFREDTVSMLRVMVMQDPGLKPDELTLLLLCAANSPAAPSQETQRCERTLRTVVDEACSAGSDEACDDELPVLAEENLPLSVSSDAGAWLHGSDHTLGRALALSADDDSEDAWEVPQSLNRVAAPRAELPAWAAAAPFWSRSRQGAPRWRAGIFGLLALLVGVLLGWVLAHSRSATPGSAASQTALPTPQVTPSSDRQVHALDAGRLGFRHTHPAPASNPRLVANGRGVGNARVNATAPAPARINDSTTQVSTSAPGRLAPARAVLPMWSAGPHVPPVRAVALGSLAQPVTPSAVGRGNSRIVLGSAGIMAANLLDSPAPAYPAAARAQRVQGDVVIEAVVGRGGDVVETRVVSGPPLLRDAAVRAVQQWRYRPYEVDGQSAEIATTARVEFRLE